MLRRLMAPALEKVAAIDLSNFIMSTVCAEFAMKEVIKGLKDDLLGRTNGGCK